MNNRYIFRGKRKENGKLIYWEKLDYILDLINRQKAENESLKVDLVKCSIRIDNLYKTADEIKSEAIKDFIDELKNRVVNKYEYTDIRVFNEIDNLVKEMTEVQ